VELVPFPVGWHGGINVRSKVKVGSGGQECPSHTYNFDIYFRGLGRSFGV